VDIDRLLAVQQDVTGNFPAAHQGVAEAVYRAYVESFRSACQQFVDALYELDPAKLKDDQVLIVERATRIVANVVDSHMLACRDATECQPFAAIHHRLRDALDGLERGKPFDPSKRPGLEDRIARLNQRLQSRRAG